MTITEANPNEDTRIVPATEIVAKYTALDRHIKDLVASRDELKPAALVALESLGGTTDLPGFKVTRVDPEVLKVDLDVLKETSSWYLFNKLTERKPRTDLVKAYLKAGSFKPNQRKAFTYEPGTAYVLITPQ